MGKRVYDVPDMHCEHCKKKIAAALKAAGAGFFGCKVSLEERTVTEETDADRDSALTEEMTIAETTEVTLHRS